MIEIRPATTHDFSALWTIFQEIIQTGDTYVNDETMTEAEARQMWMGPNIRTFVAISDGEVVGAYKILPNMPGRGAHVANGSYIVDRRCRGQGVGRLMVQHSLREARNAGFRAIQFNFVVSSNRGAIRLYEDLGFRTLATLPEAFRHPTEGYIDAYVMHRWLDDID